MVATNIILYLKTPIMIVNLLYDVKFIRNHHAPKILKVKDNPALHDFNLVAFTRRVRLFFQSDAFPPYTYVLLLLGLEKTLYEQRV